MKKSRNTLHDDSEPARVDYVILHPDYNNTRRSTFLQHDIAVLRLTRPILLNENQAVIDLPDAEAGDLQTRRTGEGLAVVAAGWGYTIENRAGVPEMMQPDQLQQTHVDVITRALCAARWPNLTVTEDMFCIDSTQTDICQVNFSQFDLGICYRHSV